MDSMDLKYSCNTCNKNYSSYKSLWNHNKKFHNNDVTKCKQMTTFMQTNDNIMQTNDNIMQTNKENKNIICKYCKNIFSHRNSRWKHEKTCKKKEETSKIILLESKVNELESKLQITNINTNNNNGIINNNIIIGFGKEDVMKLTNTEKKHIIGKGYQSMLTLINTMHCNKKYPEFNNIQITNLRDNCAKIYDDVINDYKIVRRKETIDQFISNKSENLGDILDEIQDSNNIYHKSTNKLIKLIQSYSPDMDDKDGLDFYRNLCRDIIFII